MLYASCVYDKTWFTVFLFWTCSLLDKYWNISQIIITHRMPELLCDFNVYQCGHHLIPRLHRLVSLLFLLCFETDDAMWQSFVALVVHWKKEIAKLTCFNLPSFPSFSYYGVYATATSIGRTRMYHIQDDTKEFDSLIALEGSPNLCRNFLQMFRSCVFVSI